MVFIQTSNAMILNGDNTRIEFQCFKNLTGYNGILPLTKVKIKHTLVVKKKLT